MNRIKYVLEEKGIKQTWLAEKLGKSFNMVNSYVKNRRQPSLKDLQNIAVILGVKINDLLAFEKEEVVFTSTIEIPILGNVACGIPLLAEQNIDSYVLVSKELIKPNNKYFILRAIGNSMNEAGINDGDLVLVMQQHTANNGDRVVALIDDEATIKEFYRNDEAIVLIPKSTEKKHKPIILTQDFKIQGIVEKVISH